MSEWRQISTHLQYEVSRSGQVRLRGGRELAQSTTTTGYRVVRLSGPRCQPRVHRLVAEAFIPNPENRREVNHLDGCKVNNRVANLEWTTSRENRVHAWKSGLRNRSHLPLKVGSGNGRSKLTEATVREIRERRSRGATLRGLAREFGVNHKTIAEAIDGRKWKHVALPEPPQS
jgi:hypothetical protein